MPYKKPHIPNLSAVLTTARKILPKAVEVAVDEWVEGQRDDFVERIEDQRFASFKRIYYPESGTNLSPRWLAVKAAFSADPRTMIATGHYISQIKVWKTKKGGGRQWRIGFHHAAKARDLEGNTVDFLLRDMARVHEYGSVAAGILPRPHWGPQGNRMRRRAPAARRAIAEAAGEQLKKALPQFVVERA